MYFHTFPDYLSLFVEKQPMIMYRLLLFISILLTISSCGTLSTGGKLRLVKTDKKETPVIERTFAASEKETVTQRTEEPVVETFAASSESEELVSVSDETADPQASILKSKVVKDLEDKDAIEPDDDEKIANEAIKAERDANVSLFLFVGGLISAIVPYLGIIPFIIGLIFYSRSKRARYITPFGDNRTRLATIFMIIDAVILVFWLMLIVALIFLF
jgi:hypothetical protein